MIEINRALQEIIILASQKIHTKSKREILTDT